MINCQNTFIILSKQSDVIRSLKDTFHGQKYDTQYTQCSTCNPNNLLLLWQTTMVMVH